MLSLWCVHPSNNWCSFLIEYRLSNTLSQNVINVKRRQIFQEWKLDTNNNKEFIFVRINYLCFYFICIVIEIVVEILIFNDIFQENIQNGIYWKKCIFPYRNEWIIYYWACLYFNWMQSNDFIRSAPPPELLKQISY